MSEETAKTPEIPDRVSNLVKVMNALGEDLRIPYMKGKAQHFATGDQIVPVFEDNIWTLQIDMGKYLQRITGAHIPFQSYVKTKEGISHKKAGGVAALPIKATQRSLAKGAEILDRIDTALAKPEVAARVHKATGFKIDDVRSGVSNIVKTMLASSELAETIYPTGRAPNRAEVKKLQELTNLNLTRLSGGKFAHRSAPLSPEEAVKTLGILRKSKTRTEEPKPSTPALERGLDPKALKDIIRQLPPEPPSRTLNPDDPASRQRTREERQWQKQRDAEGGGYAGGDQESFRGAKSASPGQKEAIENILEKLEPEQLAKFAEKFPEFRKYHIAQRSPMQRPFTAKQEAALALLEKNPLLVPHLGKILKLGRESYEAGLVARKMPNPLSRPTPLAATLGGTELYAEPQPAFLTTKKAGRILDALTELTRKIPGVRSKLVGGERVTFRHDLTTDPSAMPRLPERGTNAFDVAAAEFNAKVMGKQPLVMTTGQKGAAVAAKAEARDLNRQASQLQRTETKTLEAKTVKAIDQIFAQLSSEGFAGGLGIALKKGAPLSAEEKARQAITLARKHTTFGAAGDLTKDKNQFVKGVQAQIKQLELDTNNPDERIRRRAIRGLEQAQNRLGITDLSPSLVAEAASRVHLFDTASRAVIALDNHRRSIEPAEQDLTSRRLEPYTSRSGEYLGQINERGVGGRLAAPPSTLSAAALAEVAHTAMAGSTSRLEAEGARRAARGEMRYVPTGGSAPTEIPLGSPGLQTPMLAHLATLKRQLQMKRRPRLPAMEPLRARPGMPL